MNKYFLNTLIKCCHLNIVAIFNANIEQYIANIYEEDENSKRNAQVNYG